MAKTLLRSGSLDDFQAVGGGGQTVFHSALQVRETLRLRKQYALVDCLAVPQLNDEGDRVDWYSPIAGEVVGWKAADETLRTRALHYLEGLQESARTLSKKCLQSEKTAQQLLAEYGSLTQLLSADASENKKVLLAQQHREACLLAQELVRLKDDIPLGFNLKDLRYTPAT